MLEIKKTGVKNFTHYWVKPNKTLKYEANDLTIISNDDITFLRSLSGRVIFERKGFVLTNIRVYDVGGSAETFATTSALHQRLIDLGYPAYYVDGEIVLSNIISDDSGNDLSIGTDGGLFVSQTEANASNELIQQFIVGEVQDDTTPLTSTGVGKIGVEYNDGTGNVSAFLFNKDYSSQLSAIAEFVDSSNLQIQLYNYTNEIQYTCKILSFDTLGVYKRANIDESISNDFLVNDVIDFQVVVSSQSKKPIANTYANPTALFSDQANQKEGYFYSITDANGFDNITSGRATVSYKGTTNEDESDYNIEWRDDLQAALNNKLDVDGNGSQLTNVDAVSLNSQPSSYFDFRNYGLQSEAIVSNDWDSINLTGFYKNTTPSAVGIPLSVNSLSLMHIEVKSSQASQLAFRTAENFMWIRRRSGGVWQDWVEIYHSGNFNPNDYLPLAGGTLTGDLIATNFIGDGSQLTNISSDNLNGYNETDFVKTSGNETINGVKTFEEIIVDGNTVTDLLTISGINTNTTNKAPAVVYNTSNKQIELSQNTVWQNATLDTNVTGSISSKIINDRLIINGTITGNSPTSTLVGQLPAGHEPSRLRRAFIFIDSSKPTGMIVDNDGRIYIYSLFDGGQYNVDTELTLNIED